MHDTTNPDLPRRLQGPIVFERVQRATLELRLLVDGLRRRRRPADEDPLTRDVFDALDDLDPVLAEAQGLLEVLEVRVRPGWLHPVVVELRLEKQVRQMKRRRRDDPGPAALRAGSVA